VGYGDSFAGTYYEWNKTGMGYEFWKPKGNGEAAIEVGISRTEFSPKVNFGKSKLSASGKTSLHGEARSAGYNVALHSAGLSHPVISAQDAGLSEVRRR
jgi:hypothetical protein